MANPVSEPYIVGEVATIIGTFVNDAGQAVDPPTLYCAGTQGDGVTPFSFDTSTTPANFVHVQTGTWKCRIPLTSAGRWAGKLYNPAEPAQCASRFVLIVGP